MTEAEFLSLLGCFLTAYGTGYISGFLFYVVRKLTELI